MSGASEIIERAPDLEIDHPEGINVSTAIAKAERREITVQSESTAMVAMLERMAMDPACDVNKLERLWAMKQEMDAQKRRELFFEALARVQSRVPRVAQNGLMDRGPGKGQISFAKREDIDAVVRPIYLAEGFSVTWNSPTSDETGNIRVVGKFTCCGHSEEREWVCKPDASGGKTGPQAVSSTVAYGKRQVSKMFWDIIEEGKDLNGANPKDSAITQDQADSIRTRMNDLSQSKPGHLLAKLCEKYGVSRPEEITVGKLVAALADVEATEKQRAAR